MQENWQAGKFGKCRNIGDRVQNCLRCSLSTQVGIIDDTGEVVYTTLQEVRLYDKKLNTNDEERFETVPAIEGKVFEYGVNGSNINSNSDKIITRTYERK